MPTELYFETQYFEFIQSQNQQQSIVSIQQLFQHSSQPVRDVLQFNHKTFQ